MEELEARAFVDQVRGVLQQLGGVDRQVGGIVSAGWLGRVSVLGAAAEDGSSSRLLRVKAQTLLALTPDTSSGARSALA